MTTDLLQRRVTDLEAAIHKAQRDLAAGVRPSKVIAALGEAVRQPEHAAPKPNPARLRKFHRTRTGDLGAPPRYISGPWGLIGTRDPSNLTRNMGPWTISYEGVDVVYEGKGGTGFSLRADRYGDAIRKIHAIESGTFPQRLSIPPALRALQVELSESAP